MSDATKKQDNLFLMNSVVSNYKSARKLFESVAAILHIIRRVFRSICRYLLLFLNIYSLTSKEFYLELSFVFKEAHFGAIL